MELPPEERVVEHPDWTRASTAWTFLEEGISLCLFLALLVLPLGEAVSRLIGRPLISGSQVLTQHLVLVLSMAGAALAARDDRLLSIGIARWYLSEKLAHIARCFSYAIAVAVTGWLLTASITLVRMSFRSGETLPYGIPVWTVQAVLPAGFLLIGLRLLYRSSAVWSERFVVVLIGAAFFSAPALLHTEPGLFQTIGYGAIGLATLLGAPIYAAIGGVTLLMLLGSGGTVATIPLNHYSLTTSPTLPAVPLFTFAGYLMAYSDASERLVRFFQNWFGWIRGGPAVVTVLVCAFFTAFTGASGVTILALGGLLYPVLTRSGYDSRAALGLLTAAGSLGLLFPPCLPPILYSVVASARPETSVPMERLFVGGVLPGLIFLGLVCGYSVIRAPRVAIEERFNLREALRSLWSAGWELLTPVVTLGVLFGGFATPVEAAAITTAYVLLVQIVFRRGEGRGRKLLVASTDCAQLVGGVLLILGVAMALTYALIDLQLPDQALRWVQKHVHSPWSFLLALNGLLLVVGCLMDIYSAIVVVAPIVIPMAHGFGIDPVHLGVVFLTNLELGYLTPPVGMNLFLSAYRFRRPIPEIFRAVLPFVGIMAVGVLLVTYVPWLSTALVRFIWGR